MVQSMPIASFPLLHYKPDGLPLPILYYFSTLIKVLVLDP